MYIGIMYTPAKTSWYAPAFLRDIQATKESRLKKNFFLKSFILCKGQIMSECMYEFMNSSIFQNVTEKIWWISVLEGLID